MWYNSSGNRYFVRRRKQLRRAAAERRKEKIGMSIAICRVDKCSSSHDIAGIQIHDRRERQHSNSNPDIDFNRSKDNYSLCSRADGLSFNAAIDEILTAEYTSSRKIRKDAVRMVQVLFTSDTEFFADKSLSEQQAFFESCYQWAAEKWGESRIISADVHLDEKTPHMHLNFVPLVEDIDKKTGEMITTLNVHKAVGSGSRALQQLQDDFFKAVGQLYGMERGVRADLDNGELPRKNLRTEQYKKATHYHQTEINALESRSQALQATINNLNDILHTEPQNVIQGVSVPSIAKLAVGKENKDKLLYSPTDIKELQELAKATAVIAADNKIKDKELSERQKQLETAHEKIVQRADEEAEQIISKAHARAEQIKKDAKWESNLIIKQAKEREQDLSKAGNDYYFRNKKEADELKKRAEEQMKQAQYRINRVSEREKVVNQRTQELDDRETELEDKALDIQEQLQELAFIRDRPDEYYMKIIEKKDDEIATLQLNKFGLQEQLQEMNDKMQHQQRQFEQEQRVLERKICDLQEQNESRSLQSEQEIRRLKLRLAEKEKQVSELSAENNKYCSELKRERERYEFAKDKHNTLVDKYDLLYNCAEYIHERSNCYYNLDTFIERTENGYSLSSSFNGPSRER